MRSEYEPCVFDPNSALTHEFLHAAFYFATGDEDDTHTSPNWHKVGGITAELAQQWCH